MSRGERLRSYLEQLRQLGAGDLFLERLDRDSALAAVRGFRQRATSDTDAPSPAALGSQTPSPVDAATTAPSTHVDLEAEALGCTRCRLAQGRTQVVFSDGNPSGRLMVVGEAPGAQEDRTGLPFVGPAGQLLDLLLATIGLSRRESVYICNVLKCRPPGNRNPLPDEIASCTPFLRRQIALMRPEVILAVGSFAAQFLTGKAMALGKLRGRVYSYEGAPVVVTYHPAALLRNSGWTRATWDDLQLLRQVMDETR